MQIIYSALWLCKLHVCSPGRWRCSNSSSSKCRHILRENDAHPTQVGNEGKKYRFSITFHIHATYETNLCRENVINLIRCSLFCFFNFPFKYLISFSLFFDRLPISGTSRSALGGTSKYSATRHVNWKPMPTSTSSSCTSASNSRSPPSSSTPFTSGWRWVRRSPSSRGCSCTHWPCCHDRWGQTAPSAEGPFDLWTM